jgi:hypothetical protein
MKNAFMRWERGVFSELEQLDLQRERIRRRKQPDIVKCWKCTATMYWRGCPVFEDCSACQNTRLNPMPWTELGIEQ